MARVLAGNDGGLAKSLSNLNVSGVNRIQGIVSDMLIENGHIKPEYITNLPLVDILTAADEAERLSFANVNGGDYCLQLDDSSQWIYRGNTPGDWIRVTGVMLLSGLNDLVISTPTQGQVLKYNATAGKWQNSSLTTANISDMSIINAQNDDILMYAAGTGWINQNLLIALAADVDLNGTLLTGDLLRWGGSSWQNYPGSNFATSSALTTHTSDSSIHRALPAPSTNGKILGVSGSAYALTDQAIGSCMDTTISSVSEAQILQYTSGSWRNRDLVLARTPSIETTDRQLVLADRNKVIIYPNASGMMQLFLDNATFGVGDELQFFILDQLGAIRLIPDGLCRINGGYRVLTIKRYLRLICMGSGDFHTIDWLETPTNQMYNVVSLGTKSYRINTARRCHAYFVQDNHLCLTFNDHTSVRSLNIDTTTGNIDHNMAVLTYVDSTAVTHYLGNLFQAVFYPNVDSSYLMRIYEIYDLYNASNNIMPSECTNVLNWGNPVQDYMFGSVCFPVYLQSGSVGFIRMALAYMGYSYNDCFGLTASSSVFICIGYHRSGSLLVNVQSDGGIKILRSQASMYVYPDFVLGYNGGTLELSGFPTTCAKVEQENISDAFYMTTYASGQIKLWTLTEHMSQFISIKTITLTNIYSHLQAHQCNNTIYILGNSTSVANVYIGNVIRYQPNTDETHMITNISGEIANNSADTPIFLLVKRQGATPAVLKCNTAGTTGAWKWYPQLVFS